MGLKRVCEKIILIIVTISLLMTFIVAPSSYAKLTLEDGEFYYAGVTKGSYVASDGIFSWLLTNLSDIADWLVGIMTLGPRMVFVGWTALIERMLTWTLETTTGVNMNGTGVDSATDLSSITDSSSNVTVQAIVYNQVPAFDINFFEFEYDPTVSGTGQTYTCDKCKDDEGNPKKCEECCSDDKCECDCKGNCDGCKAYLAALKIKKNEDTTPPITIQLKNLVSTWYYVLRLLSTAAMLVVLIGIGIKMALSTIASEKATYKRMLIDWVVGVIILFSIHYMMWAIITINETLVNIIKESANSVNSVQLKQLYDANSSDGSMSQIDDAEIEISVYEAIRTRAYDAKLSVGLSGLIMYMTLVYFAIRYSLVYLKRYLTLVVLTLMGPPVGVAYAIQKALTGKSSTFKSWLTEYIMNVGIQSVHALIYAIFISQALVLSLQSVAGMIVGLIFMNFALKADQLFKRIFKFDGAKGLSDETENAPEKFKAAAQTVRGLYFGGKPVAKALMNTPFAKAVKGVGKVGAVGVGLGAKAALTAANKLSSNPSNEKLEKAVDKEMDKNGEGSAHKTTEDGRDAETEEQYENRRAEAKARVLQKHPEYATADPQKYGSKKSVAELMRTGKEGLLQDAATALDKLSQTKEGTPERAKAKEEYDEAMADYGAYSGIFSTSEKGMVKGHIERATEITNHFQISTNPNAGFLKNAGAVIKGTSAGIFGTGHYDSAKGEWVSNNDGYYNEFRPSNLLGFTKEDKEIFNQHVWTPIRNGLGGMASMFVGMGTIVAHPKAGMALLAGGYIGARSTFKRPASSKKYKGTYTFGRFGIPSMNTIQKEAMARANHEMKDLSLGADSMMLQRLQGEHPELYYNMKVDVEKEIKSGKSAKDFMKDLKTGGIAAVASGGVAATTLGFAAGAGAVAMFPTAAAFTAGALSHKFIAKTGIGSNIEAIQKHSVNQARKQQAVFMKDGINFSAGLEQDVATKKLEEAEDKLDKQFLTELAENLGFKYDAETGTMTMTPEEQKKQEEFEKEIEETYRNKTGKNYDTQSGTTKDKNGNKENIAIQKEELVDKISVATGTKGAKSDEHKITDIDIKIINREMEHIVDSMIAANTKKGGHNVDMASADIQELAATQLTERLIDKGVLKRGQRAESVFKNGKSGLKAAFEKKAEFGNAKAEAADKVENLDEDQKQEVREIVNKLIEESEGKTVSETADKKVTGEADRKVIRTGDKKITAEEVYERMTKIQPFGQNGDNSKAQGENGQENDGSKQGNTSQGSNNQGKMGGKNPKPDQKMFEALQQYVDNLQRIQTTRSAAPDTVAEKKHQITEKKNKRLTKVEQVLALNFDIGQDDGLDETDTEKIMPTTDQAIERLSKVKNGRNNVVNGLELTSDQATTIVEALLERKNLETINEFAQNELEIKKGNKKYAASLNQKVEATQTYYKQKLELEKQKMAESPFPDYTIDDIRKTRDFVDIDLGKVERLKDNKEMNEKLAKTITATLKAKRESLDLAEKNLGGTNEKIADINRKLDRIKAKKEKAEQAVFETGPIINVDEFIASNFNKKRR